MRGLRFVALSLLLAAIAAAGLLMSIQHARHPVPDSAVSPRIATDDEQRALLVALLDHRPDLFPGAPPPPPAPGDPAPSPRPPGPLVVSDTTVVLCASFPADPSADACTGLGGLDQPLSQSMREQMPDWPNKAVRDMLLSANRHAGRFSLPDHARILADKDNDVSKVLQARGWPAFYSRFPAAAGTLGVGRGVIDADGRHGWLYAETKCGGLCGAGYVVLLSSLADGRWRVDSAMMIWIS